MPRINHLIILMLENRSVDGLENVAQGQGSPLDSKREAYGLG